MVKSGVTFQCGRYGVFTMWENDPEKCVFTQFMKVSLAYVFDASMALPKPSCVRIPPWIVLFFPSFLYHHAHYST